MNNLIRHILLDIEGTTCPVNFVSQTLFPYAKRHLVSFVRSHSNDSHVANLLAEVELAWQQDSRPECLQWREDRRVSTGGYSDQAIMNYLQWLIDTDQKLTPLKELQGMIWEQGYLNGSILAPLFPDVAPTLHRWHQRELSLSVYSSGSVKAQQLLYKYSSAGDLSPLFTAWFDTHIGAKQSAQSYTNIAAALRTESKTVLFISDSLEEISAADQAGMEVRFSQREGNPQSDAGSFQVITSLDQI